MRRETESGRGRPKAAEGGVGARIAAAFRRIVGAPDYAAYLEHCRHVGHPPRLSEREYVSEFFERKGRTVRCC